MRLKINYFRYILEFKEKSSESEGEDEKPEDKTLDIDTSEQITMLDKFLALI